jgi:hypothetical protein
MGEIEQFVMTVVIRECGREITVTSVTVLRVILRRILRELKTF